MNILHIELSGGIGGIQKLTHDIVESSSQTNNSIFYTMCGGPFYLDLLKKDFNVYVSNISLYHFIKKKNELFIYIISNCFDIVVFHDLGLSNLLCLKKIKRRTKIPIFVYEHDDVYESYNKVGVRMKIYKHLFVSGLKNADRIIAISDYVNKRGKLLYPNNKTVTIYNGIELGKNTIVPEHIPSAVFNMLFIGRLTKVKGVQILIQALYFLKDSFPFHLSIVGDGDYREEIEKLVLGLNLEKQIVFEGIHTDNSVFYANSDVFIHPAIWNEGFGITLVESMAAGLPCIAFNKGAISEIILDKKDGFLVDEITPRSLSNAISYVHSIYTTDKYLTIRSNAKKKANFFSIESTITKLEEQYKKVLNK